MKTEQEQIEQIEKVLKDSVTDYKHLKKKGVCYCYAETLIDNGYGDVSEYKDEISKYKAEIKRLTKIFNSLTLDEKETDIFGRPVLLMFAGVKVEEAIKRVMEYDELKAAYEFLKTENRRVSANYTEYVLEEDSRLSSLRNKVAYQDQTIKRMHAEQVELYKKMKHLERKAVKQAKIDVLNKLKERAIGYTFLGEKLATEADIDELIKEIQAQ